MRMQPEAIIIGAAIADIPLAPVDRSVFDAGSTPLERIAMQLGGDAANESVQLARLGHAAALVSVVGDDGAGSFVLGELKRRGVDTRRVLVRDGLDTGINVVLVGPDGERSFVTSSAGSLRRLSLEDILPAMASPELAGAKVCCLASLFVSFELSCNDAAELFRRARARGLVTCADTTRPKRGEGLRELREALSCLDHFFPNLDEAAAITGLRDPDAIAGALLDAGVGCVTLKLGGAGCLVADAAGRRRIPAFPGITPVDTTGAGDTFAAGFIAGLLEGRDADGCARLANAAASLCVGSVGATAGDWIRADADRRAAAL
ncbi:MAG: sugar kinase [Clostridia bacterium]|nr:sugar kinase [Clostridia bacterium]